MGSMTPDPSPRRHLRPHFRGRLFFLRFVVNAFSLAITVAVVPYVYFSGDDRILTWLVASVAFGLLNAFIKPLLQVLMLPFIVVTYGFVVVLINTAILWMVTLLFPDRFHVDTVLMAILAGLVVGLLESFFHTVFGLSAPIMEGGPSVPDGEISDSEDVTIEAEVLAAATEDDPAVLEDAPGADAGQPGAGRP